MKADPIQQFQVWYDEAKKAGMRHYDAMTLATSTPDGRPSARIVLLKDVDSSGQFVFYTNYQSRKGEELEKNPHVALLFYWDPLWRQVRIEGALRKVSEEESDEYWNSRPRGSQLGAWASEQSAEISSRQELEEKLARLDAKYQGKSVPRPPHWGGYRVEPKSIEFWVGRENRLHDRHFYLRNKNGAWTQKLLSP
jgi:pyridoxamine 5'-phosphate oxidase